MATTIVDPMNQLTSIREDVGFIIIGTIFILLGSLLELIRVVPEAFARIGVLVLMPRQIAG